MKHIGAEIGVNESRVSRLHARAIRRLRDAPGDMNPQKVAEMRRQLIAFVAHKPVMTKVEMPNVAATIAADKPAAHAVVLAYKPGTTRATPAKATLRPLARRQPVAAAR